MKRTIVPFVSFFIIGPVIGCARPGRTWVLESTSPSGAPFPISSIQLDKGGAYTADGLFSADGEYIGETHRTHGRYKWDGAKLNTNPTEGPAVWYKTRRRWDGKIVMTLEVPGQDRKIRAIMRPTNRTLDPQTWTESSTSTNRPESPPPKPSTASAP